MTRSHELVPPIEPVRAADERRPMPPGLARAGAAEAVREVIDPLTAILTSAESAQRWLSGDTPDLAEARDAIEIIIANSRRAADALVGAGELIDPPPPARPAVTATAKPRPRPRRLRRKVALAWRRLRSSRLLLAGSA